MNSVLGWRSTFGLVAILAVLLGIHYLSSLGETHGAHQRAGLSPKAISTTYAGLLSDRRFIVPALSVSLVIGSLYLFFSMAPAILMTGFGFSALGLSVFFASTVFVVFGAGLLAPRWAKRWGHVRVARMGIVIALAGSLVMWFGQASIGGFSAAMTVFLLGMGLVNPLGTAIALQPFGHQAGAASALLGFLQMGCAALAIAVAASLPMPVYLAFCLVLSASLGASLLAFWGAASR
jgi:DHA1 family bicyclomycin/chloramphenicol resistance-like MFS transporter